MAEGTFATAINCMDGRVQLPVIEWAKTHFGVDYVDMITEPGPDKILAEGPDDLISSIKNRVEISVNKHGSKIIVMTSHDDCAGNPVDKETHLKQLRDSMRTIASWSFPATIVGVWMNSDDWKPEIIEKLEQL